MPAWRCVGTTGPVREVRHACRAPIPGTTAFPSLCPEGTCIAIPVGTPVPLVVSRGPPCRHLPPALARGSVLLVCGGRPSTASRPVNNSAMRDSGSLCEAGVWAFSSPEPVSEVDLMPLVRIGLDLDAETHELFVKLLEAARERRWTEWKPIRKTRAGQPVAYSCAEGLDVLRTWDAAGTGPGEGEEVVPPLLVTLRHGAGAGAANGRQELQVLSCRHGKGAGLMKSILAATRALQTQATLWQEVPPAIIRALCATPSATAVGSFLQRLFPRCPPGSNFLARTAQPSGLLGTPLLERYTRGCASQTSQGGEDSGPFEDTLSSAAASSFGETWSATTPSAARRGALDPALLLTERPRVVFAPTEGNPDRFVYLGSRPTSPAGALPFVSLPVVVAAAYSGAWPVSDASSAMVRSAALFTTISTLAGVVSGSVAPLYARARALLAGSPIDISMTPDNAAVQRACAALVAHEQTFNGFCDAVSADEGDVAVYASAAAMYEGLPRALSRHRSRGWRACNYTLMPVSIRPRGPGGVVQQAPEWGPWQEVRFQAGSSVSPARVVVTVASINVMAGSTVACCSPVSSGAAKSCPVLYIQEPWVEAIRATAILESVSRRHRRPVAPGKGEHDHHGKPPPPNAIRSASDIFVTEGGCAFSAIVLPVPCSLPLASVASSASGTALDAYQTEDAMFLRGLGTGEAYTPAALAAHASAEWLACVMDVVAAQGAFAGAEEWTSMRASGGRHQKTYAHGGRILERFVAALRAVHALAPSLGLMAAHLYDATSSVWQLLVLAALPPARKICVGLSRCGLRALYEFLFSTTPGRTYVARMQSGCAVSSRAHAAIVALVEFVRTSEDKLYASSSDPAVVDGLLAFACWPGVSPRFLAAIFGFFSCVTGSARDIPAHGGGSATSVASVVTGQAPPPDLHFETSREACSALFSTLVRIDTGFSEEARFLETQRCAPASYTARPFDSYTLFPLWPSPVLPEDASNAEFSMRWRDKTRATKKPRDTTDMDARSLWPLYVPTRGDLDRPFAGAPRGFLDCVVGMPVLKVVPPR